MSDGLVPIGTIIDWWRDDNATNPLPIPLGYHICDGTKILDDRSPLTGSSTPDLRGLFIRGVGRPDNIGDTGGTASTDLPAATGSCYKGGSDPGNEEYDVRDDNQGWGSDVHLRVDDGRSRSEGQHRHSLGGTIHTIPPFYGLLKLMRVS